MPRDNIAALAAMEEAEARPPLFSDEALALRFAEEHADDLRFVAAWGRWFRWNGQVWRQDDTLLAFDLVRAVCRAAADEARALNEKGSTKLAAMLASAKTVAAVERLAKADRRLAATVDQWDADPWLLNTPGGAIDLRTGTARPQHASDHCTKITAVSPGGDCPVWHAFLARVTGSNVELQDFLQRMAGYALTGSVREHALFFMHGNGGNGKTVFLEATAGAMAAYAVSAPMETFIAAGNDRHPTELAMLRGARLVSAAETEEGRRWAESRIKALTGGDRITARFMRQDFFEFAPQFKLLIVGNHKPGLRSVDEAIRRRFHLIPFTVTIPADERDERLPEKLKAEWPAILAWMIEGAVRWQATGLAPPAIVQAATEEYLEAEDSIVTWLAECCLAEGGSFATTPTLYASWKIWAEAAGEFVGSQKRFAQTLQARGFQPRREGGTGRKGFAGIAIRSSTSPEFFEDRWDRR